MVNFITTLVKLMDLGSKIGEYVGAIYGSIDGAISTFKTVTNIAPKVVSSLDVNKGNIIVETAVKPNYKYDSTKLVPGLVATPFGAIMGGYNGFKLGSIFGYIAPPLVLLASPFILGHLAYQKWYRRK